MAKPLFWRFVLSGEVGFEPTVPCGITGFQDQLLTATRTPSPDVGRLAIVSPTAILCQVLFIYSTASRYFSCLSAKPSVTITGALKSLSFDMAADALSQYQVLSGVVSDVIIIAFHYFDWLINKPFIYHGIIRYHLPVGFILLKQQLICSSD